MEPLTPFETMAVAVLRGDMTAARALVDHLQEEVFIPGTQIITPTRKLSVNTDKLRMIIFLRQGIDEVDIDRESIQHAIQNWLDGSVHEALILQGVDRVEMYELT